jgi:hypothetical protein
MMKTPGRRATWGMLGALGLAFGDATYFKPEPEQPDEENVAMVEVVK